LPFNAPPPPPLAFALLEPAARPSMNLGLPRGGRPVLVPVPAPDALTVGPRVGGNAVVGVGGFVEGDGLVD